MATFAGDMPVPQVTQPSNPSNAALKVGVGQAPDPLTSALNAFITQYFGGTDYNMNTAAQTIAPDRQPGGLMPNGMMIGVGQQPPMPTPNPMFHPSNGIEYDLGAMMRAAMVPTSSDVAPVVTPADMAMGDMELEPTPPPAKPKKVERKPDRADGPQRAKPKGNPPKGEPKQKTPPPPAKRSRMLAGR